MRMMTNVGPEPQFKGSIDFFKQVVGGPSGLREAWHGVGPYMAHMALTFTAYSAIAVYIHPLLAPLGTFATYPLSTIWARSVMDAGKQEKMYRGGGAFEVFERIMDKEGGPKALYNGFSVYLLKNQVTWLASYYVLSTVLAAY